MLKSTREQLVISKFKYIQKLKRVDSGNSLREFLLL